MATISAELRSELALTAVGLEIASNLLAERADGDFAKLTLTNEHTHESTSYPNSLKDTLTIYGQAVEGEVHDYGDIGGTILEPTPGDVLYQNDKCSPPRPYIIRRLFQVGNLITVDTPTIIEPQANEPVVHEDGPYGPLFRRVTTYDRETGAVAIRRGERIDYKHSARDDRTFEQATTELPDEVVALRLATLIRTVQAASNIFLEATLKGLKFIPIKGEDFV